jgi:cytoskeletal protein RodZ
MQAANNSNFGSFALRALIYKDKKRKSGAAAFVCSSDVRPNTPPARENVPKSKKSGLKGGRGRACNVARRTKKTSATPTEATNDIASVTLEATNGIDSVTTNNVARATKPVVSPEQRAAADAVVQQALENIKRKQEAQVQPPVFVPVFEYEVSQDDLPMIDDWSSVIGSIGH